MEISPLFIVELIQWTCEGSIYEHWEGKKIDKRKINQYLFSHDWGRVVFLEDNSSMLELTDFGISSSASEAWKFMIREERKGSVAAVDRPLLLLDLNPPVPPRRTWRWASRSSCPNSKSAWLFGIATSRSLRRLCMYHLIKETQNKNQVHPMQLH